MNKDEIINYLNNTTLLEIIELLTQNKYIEHLNKNDTYYTAKDLYKLYPTIFSKYKLDKYIKYNNLPYIKNGKDRLFSKSALNEWINKTYKNIITGEYIGE